MVYTDIKEAPERKLRHERKCRRGTEGLLSNKGASLAIYIALKRTDLKN